MSRCDVLISEEPEGNWRPPAAEEATGLHTVRLMFFKPAI